MNNKAKGYLNLKYFQLLAISLVIVFIPIIISSPFYLNLMIFVGLKIYSYSVDELIEDELISIVNPANHEKYVEFV